MSDIFNLASDNLVQIFSAIVTGVIGYFGLKVKKMIETYINDKKKKDIIERTVMYVEQIGSELSCVEKKDKALEKSLQWLKESGINISDTELEILIESAVNCL